MAFNYSVRTQNLNKKTDKVTNLYNSYVNKGYSKGAGGFGKDIKTAQKNINKLDKNNNLSQSFQYSNQSGYNNALNAVANREKFSYDLDNDALFQKAKNQYQAMGKTAMVDTMGQAAALTGGYGNSYATMAGQQAYNSYLQDLNNSVGDYYAMALNAYNAESDRLNNVYNALSADRNTQQNEWQSNWNNYYNLRNMYTTDKNNAISNDINVWGQKGTNIYNLANLYSNQASNSANNDVNAYSQNESTRQFNESLAQQRKEHKDDMKYKYNSLVASQKTKNNNTKDKNVEYIQTKITPDTEFTTKNEIAFKEAVYKAWQNAGSVGNSFNIAVDLLKQGIRDHTLTSNEIEKIMNYYGIKEA